MLPAAATPLTVSRNDDGRVVRLMLSGELDIASTLAFERELLNAESTTPPVLVLDLSQLRFMGVTGLRAILQSARRARREQRRLVVANCVPHIARLFELTAIDQSVELMRSPVRAVAPSSLAEASR
jgi:anti-anti-sigma factor